MVIIHPEGNSSESPYYREILTRWKGNPAFFSRTTLGERRLRLRTAIEIADLQQPTLATIAVIGLTDFRGGADDVQIVLSNQSKSGAFIVKPEWAVRGKQVAAGLSAVTVAALLLALVLHFAGDLAGGQFASGFATITGLVCIAILVRLVFSPTAADTKLQSAPLPTASPRHDP